ncbi:TniQ family protein (plasmid) [Roseomonas sp. OT10]|uniref:TniQ family protein n=1 Tax=Roseomonas cutis TaxID=2897332 RepID=UPI001E55EB0D|nr:TniQ family protein [Roseomonas sp. OT10]UFN51781.1 TniQ family protein [Roseomonas sp. OT10]
MPPSEEDELTSSWLIRTAQFHGQPVLKLLREIGRAPDAMDLSAMDLGTPRSALRPAAAVLGVGIEYLAKRSIPGAYPWARGLLARYPGAGPIRYAACPHCLEEQRLSHGVSWLRRAWVLAPCTVCSRHHAPLVEVRPGEVAHPAWADYASRYPLAGIGSYLARPTRPDAAAAPSSEARPMATGMEAILYHEMVRLQEASLLASAPGRARRPMRGQDRSAHDVVWAFTRADRFEPDRLVYEAFALERLDSRWQMARRRLAGPVEFSTLSLRSRHLMLATATILTSTTALRRAFRDPPGDWQSDAAALLDCLTDADRMEWRKRQQNWRTREFYHLKE